VQYESRAIERDSSERVNVNLDIGAGDLKVSSGTQKLLQAYFTYNIPELKPDVTYSTAGGVGDLQVRQPSRRTHIGNMKYEWDLRLSDRVPLDFNSLDLRSVTVNMGVGQLQMDLRGNPKHDYSVKVSGGVGEATVRLPANVGIEARASGGIGDISVRGLRKEGARWVNDAYNQPGVKIHVDVEGGIGSITLISD
jgi:predicted membrane protein